MSAKQRFLGVLRRAVDFYYDRFGPVRILFLIRNKIGYRCLKPVMEHLANVPGVRLALTLEFDGCMPPPRSIDDRRLFDRYRISKTEAVLRKWHYVISTDTMLTYFKWNMVKVLIPHGNVVGNMDRSKGKGHRSQTIKSMGSGIVFMDSPSAMSAVLEQYPGLNKAAGIIMLVAGAPKLDVLFNLPADAKIKGLQALGLPGDRKTIVLTSHWTDTSVLRSLGCDLVDALTSLQDRYNIIITGHEKLWFDPAMAHPAAPPELIAYLEQAGRLPHVRFVTMPDDLATLLACGDVFICDNSSVLVEACIVNRPILFFRHPHFEFGDARVQDLFLSSGPNFQAADQVADLCILALEGKDTYAAARRAVVSHFTARPGQATKYVADTLLRVGRLSGPHSPNWWRLRHAAGQGTASR